MIFLFFFPLKYEKNSATQISSRVAILWFLANSRFARFRYRRICWDGIVQDTSNFMILVVSVIKLFPMCNALQLFFTESSCIVC